MSLRAQIRLIVGALTLLFAAAVVLLQWWGLRSAVNEEVVAANRVAAQLLNRTALRYAAQGTPAMLAYLQGMGRIRSNDLTLYDGDGSVLYRSPPSPYKAGRDAPQWFERLIAPPPALQAVSFPDGRLEVRSNASRAALDAWDYMLRLVAGALLLLVAVNLLVDLLVRRTVRPFGRIVQALQTLQGGRFDVELPPLPGREAGAIGEAFNRMVGELRLRLESERRAQRAETELSDRRELARWVDRQVEDERRRIARELHDEFGQSVTAMRSIALAIERGAAQPQAARLIADEASRLYDAMHGIIPRLAPLVLDSFGLAEALQDLAERTRRAHAGVALELAVELGSLRLAPEAALALYRAAQEGITNAIKHGAAQHLLLRVAADADSVTLRLRDDGRGLPAGGLPHAGHYGLRWIAERAEALGGRVALEAGAAGGAELRLVLPRAAAEVADPPLPPAVPAALAPRPA
ncbi:methanol utilization protein MoxY [Rubrivivax gelatinosus]|nr:methanol utilization protein MoxY [Rubrivivax gelatinosus]